MSQQNEASTTAIGDADEWALETSGPAVKQVATDCTQLILALEGREGDASQHAAVTVAEGTLDLSSLVNVDERQGSGTQSHSDPSC